MVYSSLTNPILFRCSLFLRTGDQRVPRDPCDSYLRRSLRLFSDAPGASHGAGVQPCARVERHLRLQTSRRLDKLHRVSGQIHGPKLSRSGEYFNYSVDILVHLQRARHFNSRLVHVPSLEHQEQTAKIYAGSDQSQRRHKLPQQPADIQPELERTMTKSVRNGTRHLLSSIFVVDD